MADSTAERTRLLLRGMQRGEPAAADELLALLLDDLRAAAQRLMADQRAGHTLQPTALVHEAWLRIAGRQTDLEGRGHFLRVASAAMRSVLIDHARRRNAEKRGGGGHKLGLEDVGELEIDDGSDEVIHIDAALTRLAEHDERAAQVAELRCFGGLEHADIAEALGLSTRTVERSWRSARAWLQRELEDPDG